MSNKGNASEVVALAKKSKAGQDGAPVELSTGHGYAVFKPVSTILISDATSSVVEPEVPKWYNEDKGREEENPMHPDYIKAVELAGVERTMRVLDAMVMFGMELTDETGEPAGLPQDDTWLKKLVFLSKRGGVNLKGYDLKDSFDQEFLFKRYIAVGNTELALLTKLSGVAEEDIARAEESFQGSKGRRANQRSKNK